MSLTAHSTSDPKNPDTLLKPILLILSMTGKISNSLTAGAHEATDTFNPVMIEFQVSILCFCNDKYKYCFG